MIKQAKKHIVVGAGGTGGHMFPAEAVAHFFSSEGYDVTLITDKRGMRFGEYFSDYNIIILPTVNIFKGNVFQKIKAIFLLISSIFTAIKAIYKIKPDHVICFGGYPSFPAGLAAFFNLKSLYLHEQNAIIGRTNKALSFFAKKILCAFKDIKGIKNKKKCVFTGNPVRVDILNQKALDHDSDEFFNILVTGGSQGAQIFSNIVPKALALLNRDMKNTLKVLHQCRPEDVEDTIQTYKEQNIQADVRDFISDMGVALMKSDLIICRSGAGTLSEIAALGKASILVPLPTSKDDQQKINAEAFTTKKAARMIEQENFTPTLLAGIVTEYMQTPEKLYLMGQNAASLGNINAAEDIFLEVVRRD